ncbi:MAG: phosphoribosylamine--glycine ligase [Proteobacteria bacterium]|nr:phosphoribosylamine--glycine ligase [Pseudomonadota bacterium]
MNVLVIGGGGREHALCWKIRQSGMVDTLYCAPGNGGIEGEAICLPLDSADHDAVANFCREKDIGLVVVGPEAPLVNGLVDDLEKQGIKAFGPSAGAAQLEGSKGYTKDICAKYNIPTAAYKRCYSLDEANAYIEATGAPIVIKADGLAAGKGVIIAETKEQARAANADIFGGQFGEAGNSVVIEEMLVGEEASYLALVDGKNIVPLATSQDHKRAYDNDQGPNTGGMGAYSPAPVMTKAMCNRVMEEIIQPAVAAMDAEGYSYKGVLYAGLMITDSGPQLIEFNCRFGDPECQVILFRLESDLVPAMLATIDGTLDKIKFNWSPGVAMAVVMAARGYPASYQKGTVIRGLQAAEKPDDVFIFHAGTARKDGKILATGGRVLNVTALGKTVTDARDRAYAAIEKIDWPEGFCRSDIGWRAIERENG